MKKLLQDIIDCIDDLVFVKDKTFTYIACNKAFTKFIGRPYEKIIGHKDDEWFDDPEVLEGFRSWDIKLFEEKKAQDIREWVTFPNGERQLLNTIKYPLENASGDIFALVGISRDITQQYENEEKIKTLNKELLELSSLDGLTSLHNRQFFNRKYETFFALSQRNNLSIGVIMLDVDNFKLYNDTYGHIEGDNCLVSISHALKTFINRQTDIIARYGGEEFIITILNIKEENFTTLLNNIIRKIEKLNIPHRSSPVSKVVTISAGAYLGIPSYNQKSKDLIKIADKALYEAKGNGKNQFILKKELIYL